MLATAAGFALLLGFAAAAKFRDGAAFAAVVEDYRILPLALVRPFVALVVLAEVVLALVWLVAPWHAVAVRVAALGTIGLLGLYGVAMAANLLRGRTWIDCGCGSGEQLTWGLVLRNGVLALFAVAPLGAGAAAPPGWMDAVVAVPLLAICAALYAAVGTLLDNASTMRAWRRA